MNEAVDIIYSSAVKYFKDFYLQICKKIVDATFHVGRMSITLHQKLNSLGSMGTSYSSEYNVSKLFFGSQLIEAGLVCNMFQKLHENVLACSLQPSLEKCSSTWAKVSFSLGLEEIATSYNRYDPRIFKLRKVLKSPRNLLKADTFREIYFPQSTSLRGQ